MSWDRVGIEWKPPLPSQFHRKEGKEGLRFPPLDHQTIRLTTLTAISESLSAFTLPSFLCWVRADRSLRSKSCRSLVHLLFCLGSDRGKTQHSSKPSGTSLTGRNPQHVQFRDCSVLALCPNPAPREKALGSAVGSCSYCLWPAV